MTRKEIVAQQVMFVLEKLRETDADIVLATYTKEEFEELRPGEDYDRFKSDERMFVEMLADYGVQDRVVFQYIDSAGYYRYLAEEKMPNTNSSRSAYAAFAHAKDEVKKRDLFYKQIKSVAASANLNHNAIIEANQLPSRIKNFAGNTALIASYFRHLFNTCSIDKHEIPLFEDFERQNENSYWRERLDRFVEMGLRDSSEEDWNDSVFFFYGELLTALLDRMGSATKFTASMMGQIGGSKCSPQKAEAGRKNLDKARKTISRKQIAARGQASAHAKFMLSEIQNALVFEGEVKSADLVRALHELYGRKLDYDAILADAKNWKLVPHEDSGTLERIFPDDSRKSTVLFTI